MIYFVQDSTGYIKIGYTGETDAKKRVGQLQTASRYQLTILLVIEGSQEEEGQLHEKFAEHRSVGEWFKPHPNITKFIVEQVGILASRQSKATLPPPATAEAPKEPWPLRIYLAGKISQRNWRHEIVSGLSALDGAGLERWCPYTFPQDHRGHELDGWLNYAKWPILQDAIFGKHHYSGPFFASLGKVEECPYGGHSSPCNCAFEEDSHGVGANKEEACTEHRSPTGAGRRMVADLCLQAIDNSDLVFAWIESVDCYGTLIELGYAKALKKTIVLSGPRRFRDLWFADAATNNCCQRLGGISAKEALRAYLYQAELRIAKQWTK